MASLFDPKPIVAPALPADVGRPDRPEVAPEDAQDPIKAVDIQFWERALADAERAEKDWRARGREIIRIYRNDSSYTGSGRRASGKDVVFNILFSNTEVM